MKNKKILIGIGSLLAIVLVIGISYALWTINISQEGINTITSDCFKIEFTDKNAISLNNTYPIEDELGMELTPYTFTISNVCNGSAKYQINLETMSVNGTKMPDKYLKVNLQEGESSKITTKLDKSINSKLETETTINGAIDAYKLVSGIMDSGETKEFNLRIWMDEAVTQNDEGSINSSFSGRISIISSYYEDNRGTLMARNGAFWNYGGSIIKVVLEDKINPKDTDLSWDVSEAQDGRVMSYLVSNEDEETYTLYIQSEGGIKANSNSNGLFSGFTKLQSIEGLEYLDTSKVTSMEGMFNECRGLTNLDFSSFDTSNVTNMATMFCWCVKLTNLDISSFDTSNVTNMSNMFNLCQSLTNLDLSNFDTSNVTNMGGMFCYCESLINLDLSNFDTSDVTSMGGMFYNCYRLTSLDIKNFDTSNVTTMSMMFGGCGGLTSLDISNFDTSNVTDMSMMFGGCSRLTSLDINNFDTSSVTNMSRMFCDCYGLTSLDISNFDTNSVTNMEAMFYDIFSQALVYVKDENTQNWILNSDNSRPSSWTTDNVIIKA